MKVKPAGGTGLGKSLGSEGRWDHWGELALKRAATVQFESKVGRQEFRPRIASVQLFKGKVVM